MFQIREVKLRRRRKFALDWAIELPTQGGKPAAEGGCPSGGMGRLSVRIAVFHRLVGYCVRAAGSAVDVEGADLGVVERAGATTAKDGELVAGFVDGAITVDAFREGQGWPVSVSGGDEFRNGAGAESGEMRGVVPGGDDFENA